MKKSGNYFEASMTVEASFVFVIIFLFLLGAFSLGFKVYRSSLKAIDSHKIEAVDMQSKFRKIEFSERVIEEVKEKKGK